MCIITKPFFIKRVLPVLTGALLGYAYYYFIGLLPEHVPLQVILIYL